MGRKWGVERFSASCPLRVPSLFWEEAVLRSVGVNSGDCRNYWIPQQETKLHWLCGRCWTLTSLSHLMMLQHEHACNACVQLLLMTPSSAGSIGCQFVWELSSAAY